MARVGGPLFSMSASGSIGKAITFGKWKGRPWCRVHFIPENPKTEKQTNVRTAWTILVARWGTVGEAIQNAFNSYAIQFNMSGFDQWMKRGMIAYMDQLGSGVTPGSVNIGGVPPTEEWGWNLPV